MCVAATAKRRRHQMILDRRYKKRDPHAAARREAQYREKQKAMASRAVKPKMK